MFLPCWQSIYSCWRDTGAPKYAAYCRGSKGHSPCPHLTSRPGVDRRLTYRGNDYLLATVTCVNKRGSILHVYATLIRFCMVNTVYGLPVYVLSTKSKEKLLHVKFWMMYFI